MKNFMFALMCVVVLSGNVTAANFYWDPDTDATGNNITTGDNLGGTGTWDTTSAQWYNGTTNVVWANSNTPVFWGPAGGTVSLGFGTTSPAAFQTRTVTGLTFKTDGYILDGSGGNTIPTTLNTMGTTAFGAVNALLTADPFVKGTIGTRMTGTGGFTVDGGGTIRIDGYLNQNTTTGAVTVQNGSTLELAYSGAIGGTGAGSGNITLNNGTLKNTNNGAITTNNNTTFLTGNRSIILAGPQGGTLDPQATGLYSGIISGTTLTKTGTGELRMSAANQNHTFEKLVVNGGTYSLGSGTTLGQDRQVGAVPASFMADNVTIDNNAVFRFLGALLPTDTITLNANRGFTLGAGGGTIGTLTANGVIPGKITGPGGLTKISTGFFLAISGVGNDYQGTTTVNGGMLQVNSVAGTSTGTVIVNSTGILGGTGSIVGNILLSSGAHVQAGAQNGNEDLEVPAIDLVPGSFIDTVLGPTVGPNNQSDVLRILTPTTGLTLNGGGFGAFPAVGANPAGKTYTMIDYDTAFTEGSATLANTLLNNGTGYEAVVKNNTIDTRIELEVSSTVIDREWIQSGSGNWSFTDGANWNVGSQANGPGSIARFLSTAVGGAVVTLNDTPKTVGTLILDNPSPYTFQSTPSTNRILFNTYSGNAALNVVQGNHEFLSGITYMVPTVVTVPTGTELKVASTGIDNTGSMTKMGEGTLTISTNWFGTGATNINEGTLKFAVSAAGLSENGPVNIGAMGTFDMNNIGDTFGSLAGAGAIINGGNITVGGINTGGPVEFSGNYSGTNATRTFTKNGASATQILSGTTAFTATTAAAGTLVLNGTHAGTTSVSSGATLAGTGTLAGQVTVVAGGTLAPGHGGIGTIHLQGATALSLTGGATTSSNLTMELNTVAGVDVSDMIDAASSTVTIATGTVLSRINLVNAGNMTGGTYTLIDYGTLAGTGGFAGLSLGTQPAGFLYKLINNTVNTSVDLMVGFIGDYNNDNVVDAADYVVWRKNNGITSGATFFDGDGNGDGAVNDLDYAVWRSKFGSTIPGAGSGSGLEGGAVPEPATFGMLLVLASALATLRRTR